MHLDKQDLTTTTGSSIDNISLAVATAFERTGNEIDINQVQAIAKDLISEFPNISQGKLIKILRNGGFGKYGVPFKLSVCQISVWIRTETTKKGGI